MGIGNAIKKLRTEANLTQGQFADVFNVSQQSVQKWESEAAVPDLDKIIKIAKYFDISLDALILGNGNRIVEEMNSTKRIIPEYQNAHDWEFYSSYLHTEYRQCVEEGLDIEAYKDVFSSVAMLPKNEFKKKLGDILFEIVISAKLKDDYKYIEPSNLEDIKDLRKPYPFLNPVNQKTLEDKVHGAWMGRICGCMLGKTVEGIRTDELIPFLKETGNYPMHRYIYKSDLNDEILSKYKFWFNSREYADDIDGMPIDDDTNYIVLAQEIIEKYGKDFTAFDVSQAWLAYQSKNAYCTAERVAFCNFIKGFTPPSSAVYKNPFREWIGAQIRGDYFGVINPGNPEKAAEMAFRDASISHVKNGIYGEMFVAAMLATAATTNNMEEIVLGGLSQIPYTSRLYKAVMLVVNSFNNGTSSKDCFDMIHNKFDEHLEHDWCHTISNAMIVVAALLYGSGDFGKSICMAVETGFDTDCNGATVGSVLGLANGIKSISEYWQKPINDTLHTSIFGVGTVNVSDRIKLTLEHIKKQ